LSRTSVRFAQVSPVAGQVNDFGPDVLLGGFTGALQRRSRAQDSEPALPEPTVWAEATERTSCDSAQRARGARGHGALALAHPSIVALASMARFEFVEE
jgi:hypothetical protein